MRPLPAFLIVAAFFVAAPPLAAHSAPIKLPHLVKTEEKICERKADGVYCGRGLKRKHLFNCAGGEVATSLVCDFGCDPKGQACIKKKPKAGSGAAAAPATDCHFSGQLRRAEQTGLPCR
jgi:hypothetical protein